MKKVLFGLFALSTVALAAETNLYLRTGADLNGKYQTIYDLHGEKADEFSYEFAIEATKNLTDKIEFGLGIAYQKHGEPDSRSFYDEYDTSVDNKEYEVSCTETYDVPGYISVPLYLTLKYKFDAINNFVPYVKGNIGYSFNIDDGDAKYSDTDIGTNTVDKNDKIIDTYENKFDIDMKNGLYYGIGAGFEYNNFTLDLMYQVNEATAETTDKDPGYEHRKYKEDFNYSRLTLGFGYKFNF